MFFQRLILYRIGFVVYFPWLEVMESKKNELFIHSTLEWPSEHMSSNFVIVDLESERTASSIKASVESHWTEHKTIPVAKLSIASTASSPAAVLLNSTQTKSTLSKIHASKYWSKLPTAGTLHPVRESNSAFSSFFSLERQNRPRRISKEDVEQCGG